MSLYSKTGNLIHCLIYFISKMPRKVSLWNVPRKKKQIAIRGTEVILPYRWKWPLCVQAVNSHSQSVCPGKAGPLLGCYCCWRLSTLGVKVMYWLFQCQLKADNIKSQLKTIPWISQGAHVVQPSAAQSQCSQWCSLWDMGLKHLT